MRVVYTLTRAYQREAEFFAEIAETVKDLGPDVVEVTPKLEEDATGDPAVFLEVTLRDAVSRGEVRQQTRRIFEDAIYNKVDPQVRWDVIPYFRYRSESERAQMNRSN